MKPLKTFQVTVSDLGKNWTAEHHRHQAIVKSGLYQKELAEYEFLTRKEEDLKAELKHTQAKRRQLMSLLSIKEKP